jgi:hypothetical protein
LVASAVVLWPGQAPPAQAEVVTGKVVAATAPSGGQDGDDWSASAITELTAPDGTKSYVRAWSRSGELTAQEGDVLTYKELPDTKWIVSEEGTSLLVSSLPSVSLTLGKTEVGVSVGEGEASGTAEGSGPTSASVFVSGSLESDGIGTMSVLAERDNDAVFYVLASGDDLTGARALLEALELTPEGEWAEAPTGAELASPADAAREIAGQFADDGPQGSGGVSESGEDGVVSRTEGVG